MFTLSNGKLAEDLNDLPEPRREELFLDVETTAHDDKTKAIDPWADHEMCGFAFAYGDEAPMYVPMRHLVGKNVVARRWLRDALRLTPRWVNWNVKFDALFAHKEGAEFGGELCDVMTLAKLIDSDRMSYALDAVGSDWLGVGKVKSRQAAYLADIRSNDHARVPADIEGEYSCGDVDLTRRIYRHCLDKLPEECNAIWDIEQRVTSVLYDMELEGLRVDTRELREKEYELTTALLLIEQRIAELLGYSVNPGSNDDCFFALCTSNGLPVLGRTDEGNPSFDYEAMQNYSRYPRLSETLHEVVELILKHRGLRTLLSTFVLAYLEREHDGVMHPSYNQLVHTGRMSCKHPNAQQLSIEAKELVHPGDGYSFLSYDYSQIEFRIIVHYIKDPDAIAAYLADPWTDFHTWVAQMAGIPRDAAKNVNFAMGYGAGMKKVLRMLASNMNLMGSLEERLADVTDPAEKRRLFAVLCDQRAREVYHGYHRRLPGIREVTRRASGSLITRGYVRTLHGRRRHMPRKASYRAFNTVVQGEAADLMKERLVATSPRYNKAVRVLGLKQVACVHDEVLFRAPTEAITPEVVEYIATTLEHSDVVDYRVPVRVAAYQSTTDWAGVKNGRLR